MHNWSPRTANKRSKQPRGDDVTPRPMTFPTIPNRPKQIPTLNFASHPTIFIYAVRSLTHCPKVPSLHALRTKTTKQVSNPAAEVYDPPPLPIQPNTIPGLGWYSWTMATPESRIHRHLLTHSDKVLTLAVSFRFLQHHATSL